MWSSISGKAFLATAFGPFGASDYWNAFRITDSPEMLSERQTVENITEHGRGCGRLANSMATVAADSLENGAEWPAGGRRSREAPCNDLRGVTVVGSLGRCSMEVPPLQSKRACWSPASASPSLARVSAACSHPLPAIAIG